MAILPAGLSANIEQSLDTYVTQALETEAGLSVHLPGVRRFIPPTADPWVKIDYMLLGSNRRYHRQASASIFGTAIEGSVGCIICQQSRNFNTADRYRLNATRDTVLGAFPEGGLIPLYDYASLDEMNNPLSLGGLLIAGITEAWIDEGILSGLVQRSVTVRVAHMETFTR